MVCEIVECNCPIYCDYSVHSNINISRKVCPLEIVVGGDLMLKRVQVFISALGGGIEVSEEGEWR